MEGASGVTVMQRSEPIALGRSKKTVLFAAVGFGLELEAQFEPTEMTGETGVAGCAQQRCQYHGVMPGNANRYRDQVYIGVIDQLGVVVKC